MKGAPDLERCTIYVDGASKGNPGPAAIGVAIYDADRVVFEEGRYVGKMTNNMAEYRALVFGLEKAIELEARHVVVLSDSELMVRQMIGLYRVKSERLCPLYEQARALCKSLESFKIRHIPRTQNKRADALASQAIMLHRVRSVVNRMSNEQ
ncbi:MAG: ribonuclease HI family protein [Candidatus Latescibacteria bacterium]|nr:ribonuclease HI family protein [Candidatus Latescibacterota bacterium]